MDQWSLSIENYGPTSGVGLESVSSVVLRQQKTKFLKQKYHFLFLLGCHLRVADSRGEAVEFSRLFQEQEGSFREPERRPLVARSCSGPEFILLPSRQLYLE